MAYRRSRGKGRRKMQPSPMVLNFNLPVIPTASEGPGIVPGTADAFLDLSQVVSLVSRRFYCQGLLWAVAGIKFTSQSTSGGVHFDSAPIGSVEISKLPETWVMSNAWEKSFHAWQQMIENAVDEAGAESIKGRFLDYKIFADADHHLAGVGANLRPTDADGNVFALGQWQMSDITIPTQGTGAAVDYELIAVGPNEPAVGPSGKNAQSIVQGYADSRALPSPEDPNVPADANTNWMLDMFDDGTAQDAAVTNMLEATGDNPPYPFEGDLLGNADTMYPGGETNAPALQVHDFERITGSTIGGTTRLSGGAFPCGLMKITADNYNHVHELQLRMQITLVPGPHRGYMAGPMQEM